MLCCQIHTLSCSKTPNLFFVDMVKIPLHFGTKAISFIKIIIALLLSSKAALFKLDMSIQDTLVDSRREVQICCSHCHTENSSMLCLSLEICPPTIKEKYLWPLVVVNASFFPFSTIETLIFFGGTFTIHWRIQCCLRFLYAMSASAQVST